MAFYDRFEALCQKKGVRPGRAASDCGINRSNVTSWKNNGYTPRADVLDKIADYFEVTTDYLLGAGEKKPVLNEKDRRDIAHDIDKIMQELDTSGDLMFDGNPMSDEARESIRSALHVGLELAKQKNKERFTPKKYKGKD